VPDPPDRALVTGGSGFIGSALVRALLDDGLDVTVADLSAPADPRARPVVGDLTNGDVQDRAFAERPSVIFHLAARTSVLQSVRDPLDVFRVNVELTQALLEGARRVGTPAFVLASTNAVVGSAHEGVIDERVPLRPLTPYGATKAAAEMLCGAYAASYDLAAAAVRLTNVYGPGMERKDSFVVRLMRAAASGSPATIYGDGLQLRDYVYVDDAVAGLTLAWRTGTVGPLVIGSGTSVSVLALCDAARAATGITYPSTRVDPPRGEMRAVRVDISRARGIGYEPRVHLAEGLRRTWEALRPTIAVSDR
jgi:UDP-glucose 4-epimerase